MPQSQYSRQVRLLERIPDNGIFQVRGELTRPRTMHYNVFRIKVSTANSPHNAIMRLISQLSQPVLCPREWFLNGLTLAEVFKVAVSWIVLECVEPSGEAVREVTLFFFYVLRTKLE